MPQFDISDLLGEAAPTGAGQPAHPVDAFLNDDAAFKPRSSSTPPPAPTSMLDTVKDVAVDVGTTVGDSVVRGGLNLFASGYDAFGQTQKADEFRQDALRFAAKAPDIMDPNVSIGRYVAERTLENVPQIAATLAVLPYSGAAALGSMFLPLYGEARRNILDETGEDSPIIAAAPATFNTVLETSVIFGVAKKMGLIKTAQDTVKNVAENLRKEGAFALFKDAAAFGSKTAFKEAAVESAQWASNLATVRLLKNEELLGKLSGSEKNELYNSIAGGFSVGGTLGVSASVVGNTMDNKAAAKASEQFKREEVEIQSILDGLQADRKPKSAYANVDKSLLPIGGIEPDTAKPTTTVTEEGGSKALVIPITDSADTAPTSEAPAGEATEIPPIQLLQDLPPAVQSLLQNQKQDVINEIATMPEADRTQVETALQTRLYAVQSQIEMLERGLAWTGEQLKPETNGVPVPTDWREQILVDVFNGAIDVGPANNSGKFYLMPNNELGSLPLSENGNLEATEGVHILMDKATADFFDSTKTSVTKESVQELSNVVSDIFTKLGLDKHPVTGNPVKLILDYENNMLDEQSGSAYTIDPNTMVIRVNSHHVRGNKGMTETMLHELGHLVMINTLSGAPKAQLDAIKKAWQDAVLSVGRTKEYRDKYTPSLAVGSQRPIDESDYSGDSYLTSPAEFVAEQFRRAITKKAGKGTFNLRTQAPTVFAKLMKSFRRLFAASKQYAGTFDPKDSAVAFDKFVDLMLLRTEARELTAQLKQAKHDTAASKEVTDKSNKPVTALDGIQNLLAMVGVPQSQANKVADLFDVNMGFLGTGVTKLMTPLQVAEQAGNKGFNLPTQYMEVVQLMQVTKMRIVEQADGLLKELVKDKGTANRVSKLLYTVSTASDEKGSRLDQTELDKVFTQSGATPEDIALWQKFDALFVKVVNDIEGTLIYEAALTQTKDRKAARSFRDAFMQTTTEKERIDLVEAFTGESILSLTPGAKSLFTPFYDSLVETKAKMYKLRQKNYFPRSRFGSYYTRVIATQDDTTWDGTTAKKAGATVGFYTFESKSEQDSFLKDLTTDKNTQGDVRFVSSKMSDELITAQGMPASVVASVRNNLEQSAAAKGQTIDKETKQVLDDMALELTPGRKFLRHLTRRKGIAGYSEDATRTFAHYMSSAANHVARSEHAADMNDALNAMDNKIKEIAENGGPNVQIRDLQHISDYFRRHYSYLMSAEGEWAALRAAGFTWYLGFNVKSAALNFMQTPMVLFPVLTGHTTVVNATRRINGAIASLPAVIKRKGNVEPGLMATVDAMIAGGYIDESMVSDLAGFGEQSVLQRMIPGYDLRTLGQKFAFYGGAMFRVGEKLNRYIATIAAYRVAKDKGLTDQEEINLFVRDIVQGSQFEYSRFNRAEFMRGKSSFIFTFWQYMQQASYLLFGGKGARTAMSMWALALVIGGAEGLPFAEIIMGLVDIGGTQIKKALGYSNPKFEIKKQIRELITEYSDNPYSVAIGTQGISSIWGLGPLHALSLLGAPIPNVSTFGSLSYGNPVPWFEGVLDPTVTDEEKLVYKTVAAVAGPVGGIALSGIKGLMSDEPDAWKRFESMAPVFMRNASTGVRWLTREEEVDKGGASLFKFSTPEERAEAVLKGMGFQSTRVDQTRRQMRAVQVAVMYYESRRQMLLEDLYFAHINKDREGKADALSAIKDYNSELSKEKALAPLQIGGKTISNSLKGKLKDKAYKEMGIMNGVNTLGIQKEANKLYPTVSQNK